MKKFEDIIMLLMVLLTLFAFICSLICWVCIKTTSRKLRYHNLPPLYSGAVPIFGHLFGFVANRKNFWEHMKKIFDCNLETGESVCTLSILNHNFHVVNDPEDCNYLANMCLQRHEFLDYVKLLVGEGLLTSKVPKWKRHRKMLAPALNQKVIDGFYEIFNEKYRELANSLLSKVNTGEFDISEYVRRTSLGVICSTVLGYRDEEMGQDVKTEYIKLFPLILGYFIERIYNTWLCIDFMYRWSPLKNKVDKVFSKLDTLTDKIIAQRVKHKTDNKNETKFKPYLDLLLDLSSENLITKQDVKDEATTIIVAGYDTSQSAIIEILLALGTYSDVQNKVYNEILEVFQDKDKDVEKGDLAKLKYLDAVIKETLRLYPVSPFTIRQIEKDVIFQNYVLPAGDSFLLPIYSLNRQPIWGEDANAFNPERWLDRNTIPDASKAFATFSFGRRNCTGINYAMTSMKIAIVHLMRKYTIVANITNVKYQYLFNLSPVSGHFVSIYSRRTTSTKPTVSESANSTEQCKAEY